MLRGEDFGRLFRTFERTAFRLETLAVYDVEEEREEFADFLAGRPLPSESADNPWVRSMTDHGKQLARVHVLSSPLSDYLRYELAWYPGNVAAGESIGIIDKSRQEVAGLPDRDFWLTAEAEARTDPVRRAVGRAAGTPVRRTRPRMTVTGTRRRAIRPSRASRWCR
ncbi:DUF6879 family protein [Streptomyces tateyamensis]|uniref:DUF6879 family protein n=1 Tax=Streptomyces tateyamensis TaxID=565073 RepID=UPI001FE72A7C|nr:DUF6879 family protein [Streptomyces tateyamensis]